MDEYGMYRGGMSIPEVYEATGIALSTLRFRFKKRGILRSRGDGVRLSEKRGRNPHKGNVGPVSKETRAKMSEARKKHAEKNAIGITFKKNGYVEFTAGPFKGKSVHDVVMEKHLGRKLTTGEIVHHLDENKSNNHISNLELNTRSAHASHHARLNYKNRNINENGQFA